LREFKMAERQVPPPNPKLCRLRSAAGSTQAVGTCDEWVDYLTWSDERKQGFQQLAEAWMSATWNFFFWTWKIGAQADGTIPNPMWSYQLGLQQGYIPANPLTATAGCAAAPAPWSGALPATATGGSGAGAVAPADLASFPWPPVILSTGATAFTYTATQAVFSLPASTPSPISGTTFNAGKGWANPSDTSLMYTPVATGVAYVDAWGQVEPGGTVILKRAAAVHHHQPTAVPRRQG